MQTQRPTSWLLDGRLGWRTRRDRGVAVGERLRLAADPNGPLALGSSDGSLGGVVLPRGMALDDRGRLYLLRLNSPWVNRAHRTAWIKRFDPQTREFAILCTVGNQIGRDARQVRHPANIAVAGRNLYVADYANRRVQVFDTGTLMLRHLWLSPDDRLPWSPIDVAAHGDAAYILDTRHGRVYKHRVGDDQITLLVTPQTPNGRWTRIAVDPSGRIYLLDLPRAGASPSAGPRLVVFSARGERIEEKFDAGDVRDRFASPPIRLFEQAGKQLFCLPGSLMGLCEGVAPGTPPAPEMPLGLCAGMASDGLIFDRDGKAATVDWEAPAGPRLYATEGRWISKELDSRIPRCQWHRIELELAAVPPGARLEVDTFSDDSLRNPEEIDDALWDHGFSVTGASQPPDRARTAGMQESLIQSREGRYLWVRIKLIGDGYGTPAVGSIRAHFPRESYLGYLPAIYSAEEESRRFLERFLSIFQTEWDGLERQIDEFALYFDPEAVPAGPFLEYLAGWLALPLEGTWSGDQNRRLLEAAPQLYRRRGLPEGLRGTLQVYLRNFKGWSAEEQLGFPRIIEGFRERNRFTLSAESSAKLGEGQPLWSQSVAGRLQLGVFSREGEARLVSIGDPARDAFHHFAHRFRVFVPAAWIRNSDDEQMLRRAIEVEKPAHTAYDLFLVEANFRVGVQATVGVDTIVGGYAPMSLGEDQMADGRLGLDTYLGRHPDDQTTLRLAPAARVGLDTVLD